MRVDVPPECVETDLVDGSVPSGVGTAEGWHLGSTIANASSTSPTSSRCEEAAYLSKSARA